MISTAVNKAIVRRFYEKVFDRQSIEAIDELVQPEFIDRDLIPSASRNPESMKQCIKTLITS
ncbi:ester cyclase [Chamaesiphon polymorphus]|nr:ester cyclase [Chamaesiphon polymorphus]